MSWENDMAYEGPQEGNCVDCYWYCDDSDSCYCYSGQEMDTGLCEGFIEPWEVEEGG